MNLPRYFLYHGEDLREVEAQTFIRAREIFEERDSRNIG